MKESVATPATRDTYNIDEGTTQEFIISTKEDWGFLQGGLTNLLMDSPLHLIRARLSHDDADGYDGDKKARGLLGGGRGGE